MGDVATFEAKISLLKKIDIKQKEKNSKETIQDFIEKYKTKIVLNSDLYKNINNNQIITGCTVFYSYDREEITNIIFDKPITKEQFINDNVFITNENFDRFREGDSIDDADEYEFEFLFVVPEDELYSGLEYINLDTLSKEINKNGIVRLHKILDNNLYNKDTLINLYSCSIYCGNDNSDSSTFTITQEFIDSLKPGDKLQLFGNGNGSNC